MQQQCGGQRNPDGAMYLAASLQMFCGQQAWENILMAAQPLPELTKDGIVRT